MRKSILMTLGLMLGLVGLVSALDRQAEITGASNYKQIEFSTTRTLSFLGDGVFEGLIVSSDTLTTSPNSIQIWDSTSTTASNGTLIDTVYITTSVVLGGASAFTVGAGDIRNFMYKPPTPIRMNKGLATVNSGVGFNAVILYKRLN